MTLVDTPSGPVMGRTVTADGRPVLAFGGVPYARAARFGLPEAREPWEGPLDAHWPGPLPPQGVDEGIVPGMTGERTDEDCLTVEIWTPSVEGRRPVLVWVPGGGFVSGGAAVPTYDGARLAAGGDVVVVGVTYRVGVLGFLAADGVPANLGLRDLGFALGWLRTHAPAFGGDPDRLVVMGESAGAGAIAHLLTDPHLPVAGAIVSSGSPGSALPPDRAALVTSTVLAEAGVADVDGLRSLPVDDLIAAQDRAAAAVLGPVGKLPFHPVVDGEVVRASPLEAARHGRLAPVPLVVGTTAGEMELYRAEMPDLPEALAVRVLGRAAGGLGLDEAALRRGFAAVGGDLCEGVADVQLHLPAHVLVDAQVQAGVPAWRYSFAWEAPGRGACHALDLPFTFGTLDVDTWRAFAGAEGEAAAAADRLSARMREAWTSFAHDLVPACEPVGRWPRHDPVRNEVVELGPEVRVRHDPDGARRRAWLGTDR